HMSHMLYTWLTGRGYQVEAVGSGEEVISILHSSPPDLLLLDILMPGLNGLQVLDYLRDLALDTAVIMITALNSEQAAIETLRRGADDYLRKPFEPRELQAVLERASARLELRRQNSVLRRQLETELASRREVGGVSPQ